MSERGPAEIPSVAAPESGGGGAKLTLAEIRHSLRTPINHVIGYAEILLEDAADKLPSAFLIDLEKIRSGGSTLLSLVNQQFSEDRFRAESDLRAVCHKLRTTVNHIIGYGEMLSEQCVEIRHQTLRPDLMKIISAGHALLRLMEEHLGDKVEALAAEPTKGPQLERSVIALHAAIGAAPLDETRCSRNPEHVLVADDDETNRDLIRRRLEKLGYRVTVCEDGCEALRLMRQAAPDLLLLDMIMPRLNGHEVLKRIKADTQLRQLPVIMISAIDQIEHVADCIERGAEDYLAKPFDSVLLKARVGAALEKKRLRDAEQVYLRQIEEERLRSDRLILNVLPPPIADRLKGGETGIVNSYDEVTVLFADIVGFTDLTEQLPARTLVRLLDQIFSTFDAIADRHGLEKIKTIGDAYMAAAGLPFPHDDHAAAAARMASEMHGAIDTFDSSGMLKLRIGLCSGSVIAGVIGQKRFIYDLWGDTVNTASRMELHGAAGRTHVSATTYERLRDRFRFEERGVIEVKGKGPMTTYFLSSP